jgi:8-oxo-dGTP diphosphatase
MPGPNYRTVVDVMLLLTRIHPASGSQVLLMRRHRTGYADDLLCAPSGKLEDGEHVLDAVIRETREEVGLTLHHEDLQAACVLHHRNPHGEARVGFFFHTKHDPARHGHPINAEPDKCSQLLWAPIACLPADTVPYIAAGITLWQQGQPTGLHGWDTDPDPRPL